MSRPRAGELVAGDGLRLRSWLWEPRGESRGRIVFLHGYGDHARRYGELAEVLAGRGFAMLAYDQRGHGDTPGRRGDIDAFEQLLEDLDHVFGQLPDALPGPGAPLLIGHSMGGLVVLRHLQTRRPRVAGAVLSAPWLDTAVPVPGWLHLGGRVLARLLPRVTIPTKVRPEMLTRDPEVVRAFLADPLVLHEIRPSFYLDVERVQSAARAEPPSFASPTLVLVPGSDVVARAEATLAWARGGGAGGAGATHPGGIEVWTLPGMQHEVFLELGREVLFTRVAAWIEATM